MDAYMFSVCYLNNARWIFKLSPFHVILMIADTSNCVGTIVNYVIFYKSCLHSVLTIACGIESLLN